MRVMPPVKDDSIMEKSFIEILNGSDRNAANTVDIRACNKPIAKPPGRHPMHENPHRAQAIPARRDRLASTGFEMTNSQLWFRGVRSSKFRHVYGVPFKRERCYDNIKITRNAHDSNFCAVNPKFVAIVTEVAGGGAFLVLPLDHTGRLDFNASRVTGHRGPVLDIKWNPFNDNIIASCSDDTTVKLWHIPDGGLSMHLTEWLVELRGHKRRAAYIEWHPCAENILLSAGFDYLIIVWDIGKGEAMNVIDCHSDVIYCMSFNRDGSLLATTCKDKKLRIIEPRSGIVVSEGQCHQGTKASKACFLGSHGRVLTAGFSRHSDRQYCVWDQHDLTQPLFCETIDSSSGVVFPYYDYDTNMVYLAGKGDGNIRYYEVVDQPPYVHFLHQFLSGNPQRGLGFMPKRGLNVSQCEIFRFYKLHTSRGLCEPISMVVPRKSDHFQEDLFPDTAAPLPSLSARDWMSGMNAQPMLISMKTATDTNGDLRLRFTSDIRLRGVSISTHKPRIFNKDAPALQPQDNNNKKKFAFLSCETVPDYRPVANWQARPDENTSPQIIEKNQKTNTNQATKFHRLKQMFDDQPVPPGDEQVPLYKQINQGDVFSTENELRVAYNRQGDELRIVKKQLLNSQQRVRELEQQLARVQALPNNAQH